MITYSFVVPIYNDGHLASVFCKEFQRVFQAYLQRDSIEESVELIFVNDGSKDESYNHLKKVIADYPFVKTIDLSRNFGQHIAITCGYHHAKGIYVGMLNVDMQDPPSEIPKLLKAMDTEGYDIAVGIRNKRNSPLGQRITSSLFAYTMNKLTGQNAPINAATLRIMNRQFLNAYNELSEKSRYLPALELWLGFKHGYVEIEHRTEIEGKKSSYTFKRRLNMAINAILTFSDRPLRMMISVGFMIAALGMIMGCLLLAQKIFFSDIQPGFTSTTSIILFLGGIQIFVTGLCGLYIGRTLHETQNRPLYIIRQSNNF